MRNARIAKKKSVAVNNGHALIALLHEMWQCVAADEICVKGVRGCFPDKVFGGFRAQRKSAENASRTLDAQLAIMSLTLKQLLKKLLYSGSFLSYHEGVIGLTVLCMSFHARLYKLPAALSLQRSICAG